MREISKNILYENVRNKTAIVGTTPEYMPVMNYFPLEGSFFNYRDVEEERRVCILGYGIKRDLFFFRDPLGKNVKIGDQWYTVIGVMEEKAVSSSRESNIPASDIILALLAIAAGIVILVGR